MKKSGILMGILLLILICNQEHLLSQKRSEKKWLMKEAFIDKVDSLELEYGRHKVFDTPFKLACLVALSYYPELKNISIVFRHSKEISSTARVIPFNRFLFTRSAKKRVYFVDLHPRLEIFEKYSFNAVVGVIGHELGHVLTFSNNGFLGITKIGIGHWSDAYKTKFERRTDQIAIEHGLRYQLFDYSRSLEEYLKAQRRFEGLAYRRKRYMTSEEILAYKIK